MDRNKGKIATCHLNQVIASLHKNIDKDITYVQKYIVNQSTEQDMQSTKQGKQSLSSCGRKKKTMLSLTVAFAILVVTVICVQHMR